MMMTRPITKYSADTDTYNRFFLNGSDRSRSSYEQAVAEAKNTVVEGFANRSQPYSGLHPQVLKRMFAEFTICPEEEQDLSTVLRKVGDTVLQHSVFVSNPSCLAHLHCPVVIPAIAAEMLISATNQSMDSWDQSPAATYLEERMVQWLCSLFGYAQKGDGVFTSGGTQSNYMGLMLARDSWCDTHLNWDVKKHGLPKEANRFRVLCSKHAHFTVRQSAAQLGLGQEAVVLVDTDENYRMSLEDVNRKISELQRQHLIPIAVVATAGTTDFGSIDPLAELAEIVRQNALWFHVDAAYGGALAFSDVHRRKINGVQYADSLTVDFHKLFYQPISCGAFLLKDARHFQLVQLNADYLNPKEDETEGIVNLVGKSTQTTRRFDALKLFISLQTLGKRNLAGMIDQTIQLAQQAAVLISSYRHLERLNNPEISAVVFRYRSGTCSEKGSWWENHINRLIHKSFSSSGKAVFAKTKIGGKLYLKFTILNPETTIETIEQIVSEIQSVGKIIEQKEGSEMAYGEK